MNYFKKGFDMETIEIILTAIIHFLSWIFIVIAYAFYTIPRRIKLELFLWCHSPKKETGQWDKTYCKAVEVADRGKRALPELECHNLIQSHIKQKGRYIRADKNNNLHFSKGIIFKIKTP